jgi:hypothetical protein
MHACAFAPSPALASVFCCSPFFPFVPLVSSFSYCFFLLLISFPFLSLLPTTHRWPRPSIASFGQPPCQPPSLTTGGASRDRTDGLLRARQALSQLSYGPSFAWVSSLASFLVGLGRLELPTSPLSGVRSDQLSYRPSLFTRARFSRSFYPFFSPFLFASHSPRTYSQPLSCACVLPLTIFA